MADDKDKSKDEMTEDERLAAEWEAAMGDDNEEPEPESGLSADGKSDEAADGDSPKKGSKAAEKSADKGASAESGKSDAKTGAEAAKGKSVRSAPMEEFQDSPGGSRKISPDLDVILDIPVSISMEVGNTQIAIRNLLQLNQGSVIELDRLAGEPLDVLVNGTLIAHGEVVMVNDKFGIRLTDVISPSERIKRLSK
mgnify:CR=1 FL=1